MRIRLLLCLSLATACQGGAVRNAAQPSTVRLDFAWTAGLRASVTSTTTHTRVAIDRSSRSATARYTLHVDPEGNELRIRFADPHFELNGELQSPSASAQAQIAAQLADLVPDYVVTKSGEFLGVHDLPAFQGRLRTFLADIFPKDADASILAQVQTLLTSEAFLNTRAAEQWNAVVGAWAGGLLELGAAYSHSSKQPIPVFPGQQILMNYTFSARRLLPCRRGELERTCAELELRSSADPEDTRRMIQSFLADLAGKAMPQTPIFQTLEVENTILLVTEPDGLVPHAYTLTKTIRGTLSVDGKDQRVEQVDVTQVSYDYP